MRKNTFFALFLLVYTVVIGQNNSISKASPDGNIVLNCSISPFGEPFYEVTFKNQSIILPSKLGLVFEDLNFSQNFEIIGQESKTIDETWKPVLGEVSNIRNHCNELKIQLREKSPSRRLLNIVFRVFNDGVGFRYEIPAQPNIRHVVLKGENSEFSLTGNHKAFWIPGDYDTNEYRYNTTKLSEIDANIGGGVNEIYGKYIFSPNGVQTPLTMKTNNNLYINIFEAGLVNYPAMHLLLDKSIFRFKSQLVPDAVGNMAYLIAPFQTPWRTILVTEKATGLLNSKTVLNLNEPCKIENTSWIKPCKYVGIWWEMHIGKGTWDYAGSQNGSTAQNQSPTGKHSATTENVKKYIDFASNHKFDGVLVEGWNTGWEDWFGKWKEDVFDFTTPYPDFDIDALSKYAASKNVKLIMHHETSASVTNYERRMDAAYSLMKKYGYPAVKTGYVGHIIPRGEHHDGQWMINHYNRVIQRTASNQLMLCAHEPVRPTGIHRTYPNLLACEAARGNEFNAWSAGNLPEHETILPFTRLMGGPMDYTPGIFRIKLNQFDTSKKEQVHTTLCKQLALYVCMYSPLQMAADLPENYETKLDAFQFIKDVAMDWDESKYLDAEVGDFLTVARKAKGKNEWYIGSITDENARQITIVFDFLDDNKVYDAAIYKDADSAHWESNPEAYTIEKKKIKKGDSLTVKLAPGGGFAMSLK